MTLKAKISISISCLLAAYAFGRWSAPERVVEIEKKDSQIQKESDRNRHKETTKTEVTRPDGTTEKTEKTVETTEVHKEADQHTASELSKEVTGATSKVTVAALAGLRLSSRPDAPPVLYGGMVSKPILGPLTVGVWYLTEPAVGCIFGLTF